MDNKFTPYFYKKYEIYQLKPYNKNFYKRIIAYFI